jgi:hypothetical protein
MTTRDIILVGTGALAGYLLVGVLNKKKPVSDRTSNGTSLPDTSSQTVPPSKNAENDLTGTSSPVLNKLKPNRVKPPKVQKTLTDPKLANCNENWSKYSRNKRFRSTEEKQSTYDKFIETCLVRTM